MSLLVLMYHRARAERHGNAPEMLEAHFAYLAAKFPPVLPGDTLQPDALNVCLTFDDAYFDFYEIVFPLLKKFRLRAVLAVPPGLVCDAAAATTRDRLAIDSADAFAQPKKGGFCTWPELKEMAASGHVTIAAHGFTHCRLDTPGIPLSAEIDRPQAMLRAKLDQPIDSFVFPYGRYSPSALQQVSLAYRHAFRIGGAVNRGWHGRVLYRVDADRMKTPHSLFAPARLARYRVRHYWNRLRSR